MSKKNANNTIENRTPDLQACSAVLQPTTPLCAPLVLPRNEIEIGVDAHLHAPCTYICHTTKALYKFDKLLIDGKHVYEHRINQASSETEPSALNPSPISNYGTCIQSSWIINYLQLLSVQITETWLWVKWLLQNGSSSLFPRRRVLHTHSFL
jgi:hypothetical protein